MNQKLLKLQLIGCGLASLTLAAEWTYGNLAWNELLKALEPPVPAEFQSEELPELPERQRSLENFAEIVDRPVFIEGRRPIADTATSDATAGPDLGQIDDWALIGIYNKDRNPIALFSKRNEAKKFQKLNESQSISGWTLKQILADRVVLTQAGQEKAVALRKPRPQTKPPVPGRPPVPPRPAQPPAAMQPPPKPNEPSPPVENVENINDN
ncbi:hypothetical protein ACQE3E_15160 [Methylomonas sp. MED-D]|uniref:hypothetical protein n=1 Tax=unclassified Methylomonas TaxID=2608980 RepID=UPI00143B55B0|nr:MULTISPECIES: hypothetical protein [unclassified Methylomonas]MDT4331240.1 hypothetical protein [Methylomonas sp. MV1]NJA05576.1 hypothetical protein [Methylococcaceae bacterium WWC4]WGS84627.1 hypothetical protein QC632_16390 [Methylomonas sp. UP202]